MLDELPRTALILARRWARLWGIPELGDRLQVNFSTRLRRSLGRCRPCEGRITLRADLRRSPAELAEVLCHELAHVAVYRLHGMQCAPHGQEWKQLLRSAGYEPVVRRPGNSGENRKARP